MDIVLSTEFHGINGSFRGSKSRKRFSGAISPPLKKFSLRVARRSIFFKAISYIVLIFVVLFMILPLLWLINGSFQRACQINSEPVIWIPRQWLTVEAGDTGRQLLLWNMKDQSDKTMQVIQMGLRRYTATIDLTAVNALQSVSKSQLSDASPKMVNGIHVNVRQWNADGQMREVVALARDPNSEDNLMVVEVKDTAVAFALHPLDQVNRGKANPVTISGIKLNGRDLGDGMPVLATDELESELLVVLDCQ